MPAKITGPTISGVVKRKRLFRLLDDKMKRPVVWVCSPAGSGKTVLVANYLASRRIPCVWYQCDEGDADLPTFFYYMGLAARRAASRGAKPLPLLTPEYLHGIPTFTRRYFERLYRCFTTDRSPRKYSSTAHHGFAIVLDNYQEVPAALPFHDVIATGLDVIGPPADRRGRAAAIDRRGRPPGSGRSNIL